MNAAASSAISTASALRQESVSARERLRDGKLRTPPPTKSVQVNVSSALLFVNVGWLTSSTLSSCATVYPVRSRQSQNVVVVRRDEVRDGGACLASDPIDASRSSASTVVAGG